MTLVSADVSNKTANGVSRGGYYFPPFVKAKPVSVQVEKFLEIQGASQVLKIENVSYESVSADIARHLPDGLQSALAQTDYEDATEGSIRGVTTQGGGNNVLDSSGDAEVPATYHARELAKKEGVSLVKVQESQGASGAGGRVAVSDVKAFLSDSDSNQPEEDQDNAPSRKEQAESEGGNQGDNAQSKDDQSSSSNAEGSADEDGGGK